MHLFIGIKIGFLILIILLEVKNIIDEYLKLFMFFIIFYILDDVSNFNIFVNINSIYYIIKVKKLLR